MVFPRALFSLMAIATALILSACASTNAEQKAALELG